MPPSGGGKEKNMAPDNIINPEASSADAPAVVIVNFKFFKNAIGSGLTGGEFEFTLYNDSGQPVRTVKNNENGLVIFPDVMFTQARQYHYSVKETDAPADWESDTNEYPIIITVTQGGPTGLSAVVSYPEGMPGFKNKRISDVCGDVIFSDIELDKPGVYEYILRELTPSGDGWQTDTRSYRVVITVTDDGHGNLIASLNYPDGFPLFVNAYTITPAKVIISACKRAVGAPLPAGKFEFGLFNEAGELISKTTNGPAAEWKSLP